MSPEIKLSAKERIPLISVEPVNPTAITQIPTRLTDSITEPKLNGQRGIVYIQRNGAVTIRSKSGRAVTETFPELVEDFKRIGQKHTLILDGEIIAGQGKTDAQRDLVIHRSTPRSQLDITNSPFTFYAFDVLQIDKRDFTQTRLIERKRRLKRLLQNTPGLERVREVYFARSQADQRALIDHLEQEGWEGVVIKRKTSTYANRRLGTTDPAWKKYRFSKKPNK